MMLKGRTRAKDPHKGEGPDVIAPLVNREEVLSRVEGFGFTNLPVLILWNKRRRLEEFAANCIFCGTSLPGREIAAEGGDGLQAARLMVRWQKRCRPF
jgi:hypothetical protein